MKICFIKCKLVNERTYRPGDILDLEITGEHKKALVKSLDAVWYEPTESGRFVKITTHTLESQTFNVEEIARSFGIPVEQLTDASVEKKPKKGKS